MSLLSLFVKRERERERERWQKQEEEALVRGFIWVDSHTLPLSLLLSLFNGTFPCSSRSSRSLTPNDDSRHFCLVMAYWRWIANNNNNNNSAHTTHTRISHLSMHSSCPAVFPIVFEKMTQPLYHQMPLFILFLLFPTDWLIRIRYIFAWTVILYDHFARQGGEGRYRLIT